MKPFFKTFGAGVGTTVSVNALVDEVTEFNGLKSAGKVLRGDDLR